MRRRLPAYNETNVSSLFYDTVVSEKKEASTFFYEKDDPMLVQTRWYDMIADILLKIC